MSQTITPKIQIKATTLHVIPNDNAYLVVAVSNIAYTASVDTSVIDKMFASRSLGNTYVLDTETDVIVHLTRMHIRPARLIVEVNKDTDIKYYGYQNREHTS